MTTLGALWFSALDQPALEAYVHQKAADLELVVSDAYFPSVLENLAALQSHAAILTTGLERSVARAACDPTS